MRPLTRRKLLRRVDNRSSEAIPVTVCIAAICNNASSVVCASDRMITSEDVQFEPALLKILQVTTSISLLTAGDSAVHAQAYQALKNDVDPRVAANPTEWLKVEEVANLYSSHLHSVARAKAEHTCLSPLGLNIDTFLSRQRSLLPEFVERLTDDLINHPRPSAQAIVTGIDDSGPHIYTADYAGNKCWDLIGFASIGAGARHTQSQFMFARHVPQREAVETIPLLYSAKKRSEVAPGVGIVTDMCVIGPKLGEFTWIGEEFLSLLEKNYEELRSKEDEANEAAKAHFREDVDKLMAEATKSDQQATLPKSDGEIEPLEESAE